MEVSICRLAIAALALGLAVAPVSAQDAAARPPQLRVLVAHGGRSAGELEPLRERAEALLAACAPAGAIPSAVQLRLAIDARGRVSRAAVIHHLSGPEDRRWRACASRALSRLRFAAGGAGALEVEVGGISISSAVPPPSVEGRGAGGFGRPGAQRPRSSRVIGGLAEIEGALPREAAERVRDEHSGEIEACRERTRREPAYSGEIALRVRIAPDGTVAETAVVRNATTADALPACIAEAAQRWVFPAPSDGAGAQVTYSFLLVVTI